MESSPHKRAGRTFPSSSSSSSESSGGGNGGWGIRDKAEGEMFGSFFGGDRDEVEDLPNSWDRHRRTQEVKKELLLNSILI